MVELKFTGVGRDSKSKIRQVDIWTEYNEEHIYYIIHRQSGLVDGKKVNSPDLYVDHGKVKRSLDEQITLEFNSLVKGYLDKGYKDLSVLKVGLDLEQLEEILPKIRTDQNGSIKPMLCKVLDINNTKLTERDWYGSYKCDGTRMLLFKKDGEIHSSSRGGGDYDIASTYIRTDPYICTLFNINPDLILDGELYIHGKPLQYISGLARKEVLEEEHKELRYHCYDIINETIPFKARVGLLNKMKQNCPDESRLTVLEQRLIHGIKEIQEMHDEAVANGYEGLVIKDPDAVYKPGARDNRCLKLKSFKDEEFVIKGIVEGLREEDMCFLMETKDGTEFKAKPTGDRAQKQYYREHLKEIIGKLGVVKYLYYSDSEHPVPVLPVFKCVRFEDDL